MSGNIHLLLALAIVVGFRYPAVWSFVLLTKATPGIDLLWFVVRREWRNLALALGATATITVISVVIGGSALWIEWIRVLATTQSAMVGDLVIPLPFVPRLAAAAVLVIWGALTNRRWTVVAAATLALPTLWTHGLAMLVGIVALRRLPPVPAIRAWRISRPRSRRSSGWGERSYRVEDRQVGQHLPDAAHLAPQHAEVVADVVAHQHELLELRFA